MNFTLDAIEARVLGCLIEKERTTPEYYPLTLNALVNACNQKSNRDPVMTLDEAEVSRALETLRLKGLTCLNHTAGGRVVKHAHRIDAFFHFSPQDYAILCLLLLRGPQTAGELRNRSDRLFHFSAPSEVESALQELTTREDGPFALKLPRQTGQSAARYAHLFCGPVAGEEAPPAAPVAEATSAIPPSPDQIAELQAEVAALRAELEEIKRQLGIEKPDTARNAPADLKPGP